MNDSRFSQDPEPRPAKRRWPRSQRYVLSEMGIAAEASYRETIVASRSSSGRGSFDQARAAWGKAHGNLEPDDGLYLGEIVGPPKSLEHIVDALRACDKTRDQALEAMERLLDQKLIVVVESNK